MGPDSSHSLVSLKEEGPPTQTKNEGPATSYSGGRAFLFQWSRGDSNP